MKVVDIQGKLKNKKTEAVAQANVGEKINHFVLALENLVKDHSTVSVEILQDFLLKEIGEENSIVIYGANIPDTGPFLMYSKISELADILTNKFSPNYFLISYQEPMKNGFEYMTNISFVVDNDDRIDYSNIRVIAISEGDK